MVASAVYGAYSAYQGSQQAKYQSEYESDVARNNATMAGYAAEDAANRGAREIEQSNQKARALRGEQEVRLASNGLDLSSGSALSLLQDTDWMMAQDAGTIRTNAAREAWGYNVEKSNNLSSSANYKQAAKNTKPWQAAAGSLLGSAGKVYGAGKADGLWGQKAGA
jgi:hypothetical protein